MEGETSFQPGGSGLAAAGWPGAVAFPGGWAAGWGGGGGPAWMSPAKSGMAARKKAFLPGRAVLHCGR